MNIPAALRKLLAELGINDPRQSVTNELTATAKACGAIADSLSQLKIDAVDPVKTIAEISSKAGFIDKNIQAITRVPEAVWNGLSASWGSRASPV